MVIWRTKNGISIALCIVEENEEFTSNQVEFNSQCELDLNLPPEAELKLELK